MTYHFCHLLETITVNPDQLIATLPLALQVADQQMLFTGDSKMTLSEIEGSIHERFEEQVRQRPDALAIVDRQQQVSYAELNRRANQLARYLRQHEGIQLEEAVGLCLERSVECIIGLLALLKAGASYVPLDPELPAQRLRQMLEDGRVSLVLTSQRTEPVVAAIARRRLCLDRPPVELSQQSEEDLALTGITGESLAYIMYTSGSTGRPKAVGITHRGVVRLVQQ